MNGNPFYVHPGGDMTQGLQGLGQTFNQIGERKRADALRQEEKDIATAAAEKFAKIKTEAQAAYQSGDPDQIAQFNINNPEMGEAMNLFEMSQHRSEKTLSNSRDSSYAFLANPTRENAIDLVSKRKKLMLDEGVAPEKMAETDSFMERFDTDPAKLVKDTEARLAAVDTKRFIEYRKASGNPVGGEQKPSPATDIDDYVADAELARTGDEAARLRNLDRLEIKRAQPREAARVKEAVTEAELAAKLKLEPEVRAAVTTAVSKATAMAGYAKEKLSNEKVHNLYTTAMEGLVSALGGTETGPFIGLVPAITANAQIADGAIAAMAPILKQMFRASGEGTFTDSDQRLLMDMMPTRRDSPEARITKLSNIDAIVNAKLASNRMTESSPQSAQPQQAQQGQGQSQVIKFDAQGNPIQ